jgi:hypothetical protein
MVKAVKWAVSGIEHINLVISQETGQEDAVEIINPLIIHINRGVLERVAPNCLALQLTLKPVTVLGNRIQ